MTRGLTAVASAGPGEALRTFGPYVPAVSDAGEVLFQATRADGATGIFSGAAGGAVLRWLAGPGETLVSHPAPDGDAITAFVERAGASTLVRARGSMAERLAPEVRAGPLGPTARGGRIAFRGCARRPGAFLWEAGRVRRVGSIEAVAGLPVVGADGAVVVREGGPARIWRFVDDHAEALAPGFEGLGAFPAHDGRTTVFAGTRRGEHGLWAWHAGEVARVAGTERLGEVRGGLVDGDDVVVFATPPGGALEVHRGALAGGGFERVVGLGDAAFGARVAALAANPVSLRVGALAVRLALDDGTERVVVDARAARK